MLHNYLFVFLLAQKARSPS